MAHIHCHTDRQELILEHFSSHQCESVLATLEPYRIHHCCRVMHECTIHLIYFTILKHEIAYPVSSSVLEHEMQVGSGVQLPLLEHVKIISSSSQRNLSWLPSWLESFHGPMRSLALASKSGIPQFTAMYIDSL